MARARRVLRIRRISLVSATWVGALLGFVQGVLQALLLVAAPIVLKSLAAESSDVELGGLLGFLATLGLAVVVVAPLVGLVVGAIWGFLVALLVNIVLALVGGFALDVE